MLDLEWCVSALVQEKRWPRLTITLSNERQRALKQASARSGKTIRELIEASLDAYGIKSTASGSLGPASARGSAVMQHWIWR